MELVKEELLIPRAFGRAVIERLAAVMAKELEENRGLELGIIPLLDKKQLNIPFLSAKVTK